LAAKRIELVKENAVADNDKIADRIRPLDQRIAQNCAKYAFDPLSRVASALAERH
jgi:hypothetical protein